ncbi:MAG TPA: flagellar motor protein MotB [Acidobacteriaceae bacterium]|nr:flagellar motor protein MotB [Acidobacteriaceae bacterium]
MTRRTKHKSAEHAHQDRWLVSYADFITLLFAFFVVLYASSRSDQQKQTEISHSIQSAFQALGLFAPSVPSEQGSVSLADARDPVAPVNVVLGDDLSASPAVQQDLARLRARLTGLLSNQIAEHVVALRLGRDGLVISLREAGFYDSGSAIPHPQSRAALDQIAEVLAATPYDVRVEGHTDNVPIHTAQFASNWELSTARATEMAKNLIVDHSIAPGRLSAAGFAEYRPVASNDTTDGRSQNRRVDIIVLPRISVLPAKPPAAH